jgi:hypothetical protein
VTTKKRHAPANASVETTHVVKQGRSKGRAVRRRVAARNFGALTQTIISDSQHIYRSLISAEGAYPSNSEEVEWAAKCWKHACRISGADVEFDNDFKKLVCFTF